MTVVFNQTAAYPDVRVLEYSGADTTNPLDVTAGASGTGSTGNSGQQRRRRRMNWYLGRG